MTSPTTLLISIVVTIVLAVLFHAWLRRGEERRAEALRQWADSAGWRVRSAPARTTMPSPWVEYPPAVSLTPMASLDGERDGYPLILEWIFDDEHMATVCYATLRHEHPRLTLRRRPFAGRRPPHERYTEFGRLPTAAREVLDATSVDFWQVSGRDFAAIRLTCLVPSQIDAFLGDVIAMTTAIDEATPDESVT